MMIQLRALEERFTDVWEPKTHDNGKMFTLQVKSWRYPGLND